MNIQLSDHFNYRRLLRFAMPSIMMMIFTSIYGVVDGFFISNFVGKIPFAAVNFIMPVCMILGAVGFVFGTGGSALVAKTMGEGDYEKANRLFSLFVYTPALCGVVLAIAAFIFFPNIAAALGAEEDMLQGCIVYGRILMFSLPAFILQFTFQSFFVTAEKPQLGFIVTVAAGITNMVLDALFIAALEWGIAGAAAATGMSQIVGGVVPCIYFARKNSSTLRLTKTVFDRRALVRACTNGVSEFVTNIAMSIVGVLYNIQLLRFAGEDGVAAYGVLMYVNFIFISIFAGYSVGTAPIFGFNYGAQNHAELKNLLRKSLALIAGTAVTMFAAGELLAKPFSYIFVSYDAALFEMTVAAFRIYSISFLMAGFNIFGSAFFTALNNGLISAIISFMRTLVFEVAAILILPLIWGLNGVWSAIIVAEFAAMILTGAFMVAKRSKYHY